MAGQLQDGAYHAPGVRPGAHFTVVFLRAARDVPVAQVGEALGRLWAVYNGLRAGDVRDLPGHPVPSGRLTVLLGYGPNVFSLPGVKRPLPAALGPAGRFRSPLPTGGGPLLVGSGLRYAPDVTVNLATEEFVVQFIADTALAVNRGVVETWKLLEDICDPVTGQSALMLTSFFSGFQRDDGRSWIDFHDGLSNLRSDERLGAIQVKRSNDAAEQWTEGGTYVAFIRTAIDLSVWRKLHREEQEMLVGRDKLSGCALQEDAASGGTARPPGCPFAGTAEVTDRGNEAFREPPIVAGGLASSHVQRANHHVAPAQDENSLRIFRQGYEFLEPIDVSPGFRPGLNFVSFQDTPARLLRILTQPGWLGQTNFGGTADRLPRGMDRFLSVRAAGIYFAPPVVEGEPYPGASLLT